ncbi:MAG TPA: GlsB/YeaQ/YmgE family stress response membrane protein [Steroidobacteraceae bacterium]|nr:GlsB/YeaQ/YmgE family stress response membrane protein [Steroidobacteraceae bacterium]
MLHYLWMFIIGIVVGALARFIMPGAQHMGILMTGVLGIVGSFVGGFITRLFNKPAEGAPVHPAGIIMSVIGALIVLFIWEKVVGS